MGSVTERFIEQVHQAETHLLETGIIALQRWSGGPGEVPEQTLLTLMRDRCKELGWHPVVASFWAVPPYGDSAESIGGNIRIPATVYKRGLGAELTLAKEAGRSTQAGDMTLTFYKNGQLIKEWIDAQDPRVTKVLIRKGR